MEQKRVKIIYFSWSFFKGFVFSIESKWIVLGKWSWRSIFKGLEAFPEQIIITDIVKLGNSLMRFYRV
jgi:hypothetical protein